MEDRLAPLCLLPPATDTPWCGHEMAAPAVRLPRRGREPLALDQPLFWHAPDWYRVSPQVADALAVAVSRQGIAVAALRSELAGGEGEPQLHAADEGESYDQEPHGRRGTLRRIVPYRPERYGLSPRDFDDAAVIDVRLAMGRDDFGRFAFSPAQIQRWESTPDEEPLAGGSWLPSATFPPDVVSLEDLESKFDQLRRLAPSAAVMVSLVPARLDAELPPILSAGPDGVILRVDDFTLDGLQLAALVRRSRQLVDRHGGEAMPLWIVPGFVTPDDVVKLLALGASAVAVDSWCRDLRDQASRFQATSPYAYSGSPEALRQRVEALVAGELAGLIERVEGLALSVPAGPLRERLGSFSAAWSKTLGVRPLG